MEMQHGDSLWSKHADELRNTWQFRALYTTRYDPIGMVVLSVLAHSYDDAMPVLLNLMFDNFYSITTPFVCSAGKINKRGQIIADVQWRDWEPKTKDEVMFHDSSHLRNSFRKLADKMKLSDGDRRELFVAVRKWVVADQRLDPNMDPADPDAKRLTIN